MGRAFILTTKNTKQKKNIKTTKYNRENKTI